MKEQDLFLKCTGIVKLPVIREVNLMINVMSNICQYVEMPSKGKVLDAIRKNTTDLYHRKVRHVFVLQVQFSLFTNSLVCYIILVIILCWPVSGHFLKLQSCVFDIARRAARQEA